jgi:sulfate adenylyltransferase (ADP) / ATP adenylyltransferase
VPIVAPEPALLRETIAQRGAHALQCGALLPIDTTRTLIEDGGVRFVVREVSSLARKAATAATHAPRVADPFLPYDPDLFVADLSGTHVALLNKYNVIANHLLIVTRRFEPQEALIDRDDFEALVVALRAFDGLGFYNGGPEAGASQAHKHLQVVPLPLDENTPHVPIEALFDSVSFIHGIGTLPRLHFRHAFAWLDLMSEGAAQRATECYRALIDAAGIGTRDEQGVASQAAPYNLLLTRRWMLVVPRTTERVEGISVNSLGFAGSLFVRDAAQRRALVQLGPMAALGRVAVP